MKNNYNWNVLILKILIFLRVLFKGRLWYYRTIRTQLLLKVYIVQKLYVFVEPKQGRKY